MRFNPWGISSAGDPHVIQAFGVPTYGCCVMNNTLEMHLTPQVSEVPLTGQ